MSPRSLKTPVSVLVVDDEPAILRYMQTLLEVEGYRVQIAGSGQEALQMIGRGLTPDLVFLDVVMPELGGLDTLQRIRQLNSSLKVVMVSCINNSRKVVQALRMGAVDYLTKPFSRNDLDSVIDLCVAKDRRSAHPAEVIEDLGCGLSFVAATPVMHNLRAQAEQIAKVDIPVLLLGESGTGKEVFARLIHNASPRADRPFLKINCAAIPPDLLESELFGYEAGAFTGAAQARPGKFEICNKGTILLDEIGELSPALQAKLLHVLQDQQFSRLGSRSVITADVRVLAATNVHIERAITAKKLREDLYYRLSGFTLRLPPLRERKDDIHLLLKHFMHSLAERCARPALPITQAVLDRCLSYAWPGNVRELENFVKRSLVLGEFSWEPPGIAGHGTRLAVTEYSAPVSDIAAGLKSMARSARQEAEIEALLNALKETNWNQKRAAMKLRISYKALLYKVREYELERPQAVG